MNAVDLTKETRIANLTFNGRPTGVLRERVTRRLCPVPLWTLPKTLAMDLEYMRVDVVLISNIFLYLEIKEVF